MSNFVTLTLPSFDALKAVSGQGLKKFYADNQATDPALLEVVAACTIDGDQSLHYSYNATNGDPIPKNDAWFTGATRLLELPI